MSELGNDKYPPDFVFKERPKSVHRHVYNQAFSSSIASFTPLQNHDETSLMNEWLGNSLLEKLEKVRATEKIFRACTRIILHAKQLEENKLDGLKTPLGLATNKAHLNATAIRDIVRQIVEDILPPHLQPNNTKLFISMMADRLTTLRRTQLIIHEGAESNKLFSHLFERLLSKLNTLDIISRNEILSAISINTCNFVVQIIFYYLRIYFTLSIDKNTGKVRFVHSKQGMLFLNEVGDADCKLTTDSWSEIKESKLSLEQLQLTGTLPEDKKYRLSLVLGRFFHHRYPKLVMNYTIDFYVCQLFKFKPRYVGALKNHNNSKNGQVSKKCVEAFILDFFKFTPQKWILPTHNKTYPMLAEVLSQRIFKWKLTEDFMTDALSDQAHIFDFFQKNHLNDFTEVDSEETGMLFKAISHHTFRLFCFLLLQTIYEVFSVRHIHNGIKISYGNKENTRSPLDRPTGRKRTYTDCDREPSENSDLETFGGKRSKLNNSLNITSSSPSVRPSPAVVEKAETPLVCIDIDDDDDDEANKNRKPQVADMKRVVAPPPPKSPKPVFDLSLVKKERIERTNEQTEKEQQENVAEQLEELTVEKIDFKKFKSDIEADQNILSIYKTIFGIVLDSREQLRLRCIKLLKENASLKVCPN